MSPQSPTGLLIGVGNPYRRDDGVGVYVLRQLQQALAGESSVAVATLECSGEGTELMQSWGGYRFVYLFDAVRSQQAAGSIHRFDTAEGPVPVDFFRYSSHAFSVAEAVEMARMLDQLPSTLVIYGIEGADYQHGTGLSGAVERAANRVVEMVLDVLRQQPGTEGDEACMNSA